jgi:succinate dehydrogenase / fumarate reductase iron-sulfur subunit
VAACANPAAMLFTSAKVTHLNTLPQGQPERDERTLNMIAAMTREDFGTCSNHAECEAVRPKGIPLEFVTAISRDLIRAAFRPPSEAPGCRWRAAATGLRGYLDPDCPFRRAVPW